VRFGAFRSAVKAAGPCGEVVARVEAGGDPRRRSSREVTEMFEVLRAEFERQRGHTETAPWNCPNSEPPGTSRRTSRAGALRAVAATYATPATGRANTSSYREGVRLS
jgi:hypothetical protein